MRVTDPPTSSIAMLTPSTASAPSAFDSSPMPAATPRYADAGIVVTEIATPTAELALVSSARIPATPSGECDDWCRGVDRRETGEELALAGQQLRGPEVQLV